MVGLTPTGSVLPDRQGTAAADSAAAARADLDLRSLGFRFGAGAPPCSYLHLSPLEHAMPFCHSKHGALPPLPPAGPGVWVRDLGGGRAAISAAVAGRCSHWHSFALFGHCFVWNFQHGPFRSPDGVLFPPFPRPLPRPRPPPGDGVRGVRGAGE